jgi:hypothetical protein
MDCSDRLIPQKILVEKSLRAYLPTGPSDIGLISLLQYSLTCGPFWEHTVKCVGRRMEKWGELTSAYGGVGGSNPSHP